MVLSGACAIAVLTGFAHRPQPDQALCAAPDAPAMIESDEDVRMSVMVRRIPL